MPHEHSEAESPSTLSRLLDAQDVADLLGVPKTWVYAQTRRGTIPSVKLGRYSRYRREAIVSWVEANEAAA